MSNPPTYAGHGSNNKLLLEFPFVFYNAGARTVLVDDLRIRLPVEGGEALQFNATVEKIGTDEGRAFATCFFVGAQHAIRLIREFQRNPGDLIFEARDYRVGLEARLNGSTAWTVLHSFELGVVPKALESLGMRLIVHKNGE